MNNIATFLTKNILYVIAVIIVVAGGYYFFSTQGAGDVDVASAVVVHEVSTGTVSTGIQTTGSIVAANVLDLDVYKLATRIEEVGVVNGSHVEEGDLLFAFDQSDVEVDIAQSYLDIEEARLALAVEEEAFDDTNTTVTSLENDIEILERNLVQHEEDLQIAFRDFLNADLEAEPTAERYDEQIDKMAPTIGGLYNHAEQGTYVVEVYKSSAESGYSYTLSGLESGTYSVYLGTETLLGTRGLTIVFPVTGVDTRDEWVVAVPNVYTPDYPENSEDYEDAVEQIQENMVSDTVTLTNKKTQLEQARRGDTVTSRELEVDAAELAIQRAQVDLQDGVDEKDERYIVAPFSGTVEGMENVVMGATPTKDSDDPITFGSLISDDFQASFSLGAGDIDKVSIGQTVEVALTSVSGSEPLTAEVVEISSLPDSSTVAQYEVLALIRDVPDSVNLRDGMLADIVIFQEEKESVLRVPTAAVSYEGRQAQVTVLEDLSEEERAQVERIGILRVSDTVMYTSFTQEVEIGLAGSYYLEIVSGLEGGELLEVSSVTATAADTSVVSDVRMGPGGGTRRD